METLRDIEINKLVIIRFKDRERPIWTGYVAQTCKCCWIAVLKLHGRSSMRLLWLIKFGTVNASTAWTPCNLLQLEKVLRESRSGAILCFITKIGWLDGVIGLRCLDRFGWQLLRTCLGLGHEVSSTMFASYHWGRTTKCVDFSGFSRGRYVAFVWTLWQMILV